MLSGGDLAEGKSVAERSISVPPMKRKYVETNQYFKKNLQKKIRKRIEGID